MAQNSLEQIRIRHSPLREDWNPGQGQLLQQWQQHLKKNHSMWENQVRLLMDLALSRLHGISKEQVLRSAISLDTDIAAGRTMAA